MPTFPKFADLLVQVVAEVEAAVGSRLSNSPGRPEQLVVVLDCRGAPTLQACQTPPSLRALSPNGVQGCRLLCIVSKKVLSLRKTMILHADTLKE